jgi:hypothetical protein
MRFAWRRLFFVHARLCFVDSGWFFDGEAKNNHKIECDKTQCVKPNSCTNNQSPAGANFELFRLSKSKDVVDVCSNTLRAYNKQGLPFYRQGRAIFVSKAELAHFIRQANSRPQGGA